MGVSYKINGLNWSADLFWVLRSV